jgi:hypothetical protein
MLLGMLAVDLGFIGIDRHDAFVAKRREAVLSGDSTSTEDALLTAGMLDAGQLAALQAVMQQLEHNDSDIRLGRLLVAQRHVTAAQIYQLLRMQKALAVPEPLAVLLVREQLITPAALEQAERLLATLATSAEPPDNTVADSARQPLGSQTVADLLLTTLAIEQGFIDPTSSTVKNALRQCESVAELVERGVLERAQRDALERLFRRLQREDVDVALALHAAEQGLLGPREIEQALWAQQDNEVDTALADVCLDLGLLDPKQLGNLLAEVERQLYSCETTLSFDEMLLATLAVDQGVISQTQLDQHLTERDPGEPLWVHLINVGLISETKFAKLNKLKQRLEQTDEDILFAKLVADSGLVAIPALEEALRQQKAAEELQPIGDILLRAGQISVRQKRAIDAEVAQVIASAAPAVAAAEPGKSAPPATSSSLHPKPSTTSPAAGSPAAKPAPVTATIREQTETPAGGKPAVATGALASQQAKRFGRYEIMSEISRGGMGIIYKARNTETNEVVAIKTLAPHLAINTQYVDRFTQEAQALHKVAHPNIVAVRRVGHGGNVHFMEMEYVDGEQLRKRCERMGPMPVPLAIELIMPIVAALEHAWSLGVVHRDVKPENILIAADGRPKLVDFGIAKNLEGESHTRTGDFFGSPLYTAPEQLKHARSIDFRADIYAIGACLYRMLVGEPPFSGDSAFQVIARVLHDPIAKRAELPVELGWETYQVLEQLLAKDPADRPRSGAQMRELLQSLLRPVACTRCQTSFPAYNLACPTCRQVYKPVAEVRRGRPGRAGSSSPSTRRNASSTSEPDQRRQGRGVGARRVLGERRRGRR